MKEAEVISDALGYVDLRPGVARSEPLTDLLVLDRPTLPVVPRREASSFRRRGWLIRRLLLVADIVGLTSAFVLAELALPRGTDGHGFGDPLEFALFAALLPVWVVAAKFAGLYDRDEKRADHSTTDDLVGVFVLATLLSWLYARAGETGAFTANLNRLTAFWSISIVLVVCARVAARAFARRHPVYVQNTVIVGAGDVGQLLARKFQNHPEYGIKVVGFIDSRPRERRDDLGDLTLLGPVEEIRDAIAELSVERVVIAFSSESHEALVSLVRSLSDMDVQVDVVPRLFEVVGDTFAAHSVEGIPLLGLRAPRMSRSSVLIKRALDVTLSSISLVLLSPILVAAAVSIKLETRGPVFFRQSRMGFRDQPFRIFKFRTMVADAESQKAGLGALNKHAQNGGDVRMFKVVDDPRITRVGRFLRRFSIDELPQLINVLKGEMSIVGPRPLIPEEDRYVLDWARKRLNIKPGITGPWQVLGRSDIPFEEMVRLDYDYVTRWSLYGDVKLMFRTFPAITHKRGAY